MVYPSLEIIETRGPFTEQIALALADNAQQKTVILGSPAALAAELTAIEARVSVNGQPVATGTGRRGARQSAELDRVAGAKLGGIWSEA